MRLLTQDEADAKYTCHSCGCMPDFPITTVELRGWAQIGTSGYWVCPSCLEDTRLFEGRDLPDGPMLIEIS